MNSELEMLKGMLRSGRDLAGTVGSALIAEPIAGIGGLATLARTGGDTAKAAARIEALRDRLSYTPTDEGSQRTLELFAKPFVALDEHVIQPASDAAYEVGGPVAGAAMNTALNMVDPLRGKGKAAKRGGAVKVPDKLIVQKPENLDWVKDSPAPPLSEGKGGAVRVPKVKPRAQHIDIRSRGKDPVATLKQIQEEGFKPGANVLPGFDWQNPTDVIQKGYTPNEGDLVYFPPKKALVNSPNGLRIKEGWKPKEGEFTFVKAQHLGRNDPPRLIDLLREEEAGIGKKAEVPEWERKGLPPPKGWYDANKDPVALEQQARMDALRKEQPHLFEDQPAPVFDHADDPMFDRDPDEVLNPQQRAPLDQKFGTDTTVDWGGPPEGGLFNFNDPMHFDYVAEFVDPDGTIPQAQLDTAVRHEMARLNATAPTEIGGLGLGPNNTPMERAKALGFEGDMYHGSLFSDIEAFDPSKDRGSNWAGSGTYTTTNPADASTNYANPFGIDIAEKMREAKMYFEERMDPEATGEMDMPDGMTPDEYGQVANALDAQSNAGYNQLANRDMFGASPEATEKMVKAMGLGNSLGTVYPLMLRKGKELNAAKAAEHVPIEDIHTYMQDMIQQRAWIGDDTPLAIYRDQPGAVPDSVARELFNKMEINPRDLIRDFDLPNDFNTFTHRPKFGFPHEQSADLHTIARDPKQVRSRFAAFDPGQRESPNILALQGLDPREILKRKLRETALNAAVNAGSEQQGE